MEILLNIDNYEALESNNFVLSTIEKDKIKKQIDFGIIKKCSLANIGPGVDWLVILLLLDLGLQLIKVGAEINDGVDGWIEIGKKLYKLFRRKKIVSIDVDGATALAIEHIAKKEKITKLVKLQESTINFVDISGHIPANKKGLSKKPHNYYIQTYLVNDEKIYVLGVKSTGETNILKLFSFSLYGFK